MKTVCTAKCLFFLLLCSVPFGGWSQKRSAQLEQEQSRLEKKLSTTKSLLEKVRTGTQASLNEMKLIDNQVKTREELVQNFDNQIKSADYSIESKSGQVKELTAKIERLKQQYRKLLIYAYKHRNRYGKMMFVFSSANYFEAVKRNAYLRHVRDIQQKQFMLIRQNQSTLSREIGSIRTERSKKAGLLQEKIGEKDAILRDKVKQQETLNKLKKDEARLMSDLKDAERKKAELKRQIRIAIEKEIAEEEAKRKRELAKKNQSATTKTTTTAASPKENKAAPKKEIAFTETKESLELSRNFEANRGKLPWPVLKGTITEGYGRNPHPTIPNVYTNNNGIDIGSPKNSQVRCVFEGEVTSVLNIPGAGKVVIVKHGNYRTVYSNLQEVYVGVGAKISTKQAIGALLLEPGETVSTAHFEIHQVAGTTVTKLNPTLWLTQ